MSYFRAVPESPPSAHEVYAFIDKPFEPVLHFTARQGDMLLSPWIELYAGLDLASTCETLKTEKPTR